MRWSPTLLADLRPGNGLVGLLTGLDRGQAVLEELRPFNELSVALDVNEDSSQSPALGYEQNLLALTEQVKFVPELAPQIISCNYTGNCHIEPFDRPYVQASG